jgi:predicted PurR-regulated permease PerM
MLIDRVGNFLAERTPRRAIALGLFAAILIVFRKLLLLLVFFVAFERAMRFLSEQLARRMSMRRRTAVLVVALVVLAFLVGAATFGVERLIKFLLHARDTVPARIAAIREEPLFQRVQEHLPDADTVVERAQHYAGDMLHYLAAFGHILLYITIGFILAVVFLLERDEIDGFTRSVDPTSLQGTLLRWFGHVADAMLVTVEFQLVVAACNAALTVPILIACGIPHVPALALMIFFSGLVPVVGNFVSGAILSLLAWKARGWLGVGTFVVLTFVLHKLESYYLNPRLAARHVRLPGFVLIVSLLLWEHMIGFAGLFLSFPFLFVAKRIRDELRGETPGLAGAESARLS